MELKNISQTKIVNNIPGDLIPNCFYLLNSSNGVELHYTDKNSVIKKISSFEDVPSDNKEYLRYNKTWKAFTGWQFKELQQEDLNDIKTPGFYGKFNSSETSSSKNYPSDAIRGGHLLVLPMTTNTSTLTIFQVYFSVGTKSAGDYTNTARIFMRSFINNAQWLPWREFDGGKLHQLSTAIQNLNSLHNNTFPLDESTFIVNQETTINIPNQSLRVSYIKNTDSNITFSAGAGVTLIGDTTITAPIGTKIDLTVQNGRGYINYMKPQTQTNLDNNIGTW